MIITLKSQVPFKCQLKQINNNKKKTATKQMLQQTSLRLFNILQRKGFSVGPTRFPPPTGDVSPQTNNTSALTIRADAG